MNDDFEKVLKEHPLKVIRLSWLISIALFSLFSILSTGYFFWDQKLDDIKADVQKQINMIKDTTNSTNTNVNVVDTKVSYLQRQMDQLNRNLNDFLLAKNYRAESKNKIEQEP